MAATLVGGAFLSASLQVLFDRLASREFINFFRGQKYADRLLKKLKIVLLALNSVVDDAEGKQITNQSVKDWLQELKDAIYHADDLLDEIATKALQCNLETENQSNTKEVQNLVCSSSNTIYQDFVSRIEETIDSLEYFLRQKDVLGLREGVGMTWSKGLPTTSLVNEDGVYGRDRDIDCILKLLLSDDAPGNQISVIPIVGMGGVGKTTLAQVVYNDERVERHFDKKAWVCVSEEFDVFKVTKTILAAVTSFYLDVNDLDLLQVKLRDNLREQKFLIVLDGVWNENYDVWEKLSHPLRYGAQGSKIIVTTRSENVASIMRTVPMHHLGLLSDEDCWSLFARHAFGNRDFSTYPQLEAIGKKVLKKCKGLPLAAKALGGLLRYKVEVEEWNHVLKSNIWDFTNDSILPALRLSYHHLPAHLKRCFAYCSLIPKDYAFNKKMLVLLWIAENLVPKPKGNRTIEEAGEECLQELVSRSLIQQCGEGIIMHDLVNDLAQFVSAEFCFRLEDEKPQRISEKVRYFSYMKGTYDAFEKFKAINEVACLRTFLPLKLSYIFGTSFLTNKVPEDILPRLRFLRVLSLSHYNFAELPNSIGNLIHLRFLDLSHTKIKYLPDSITTLCNLQTLFLSGCCYLTELPADLRKLVNLRHLDLVDTNLKEMPVQMSGLKNLYFLTTFVVGKNSGSTIKELRDLYHLHGSLSISSLQNVVNRMDASAANLKDKEGLQMLSLEWSENTTDTQNEREVLENLQPHKSIKNLAIKNYGGTIFPDWLGNHSFCNLVSLCLRNCGYCLFLPALGQLPCLEDLTIGGLNGVTKVGQEFYGDCALIRPFQALKKLSFEKMQEWEEWCILGAGEFSCLQVLSIIDCPKLRGSLPIKVSSVEFLRISRCQQLTGSLHGLTFTTSNQGGLLQELSSLRTLELTNLINLKELPLALCKLNNLQKLKIKTCPCLESFPDERLPETLRILEIEKCHALLSLPKEMCFNSCLQDLSISKCSSLVTFPTGGLPIGLQTLYIRYCEKLELPLYENMELCFKSLQTIWIFDSCVSLKSIPLGSLPKLRSLSISYLQNSEPKFDSFPILYGHHNLISLHTLDISFCPYMISFPEGGLPAPNLTSFTVSDCPNLESLPEQMCLLLPSLQSLSVDSCPKINSFPEGGLPLSLHSLCIMDCEKLMDCRMHWGLQKLFSLKELTIQAKIEHPAESFPEEWLLPSSLTSLTIYGHSDLTSLNYKGLQHLISLKTLLISSCHQLKALPEEGLPNSLTLLSIRKCPLLKPRCRRQQGEDWSKISSIRCIKLDDEVYL